MTIQRTLNDFKEAVIETNIFLNTAHEVSDDGQYVFNNNMRRLITESSFLKLFVSWEKFTEQSFIKYMTGKKSIANNKVQSSCKRISMDRAAEILKGTNKYIDWSNPDITLRLAKLYFGDINPYSNNLNPIKVDLFDLRTIRNAAAHLSTTTNKSLDSLASRILQSNQSNTTVSDFILSIKPETTDTVFDYYSNILDVTSENIANA